MAFSDWTVVLAGPWPNPNRDPNFYTGIPIDPNGITQSRFEMTLTHVPSQQVLHRSDLTSDPSPEFLTKYAQDVIAYAERHMQYQKVPTDKTTVTLDVVPVVPIVPVETPDQIAIRTFQATTQRLIEIRASIASGASKTAQAAYDTLYSGRGGFQEQYADASEAARPVFDKVIAAVDLSKLIATSASISPSAESLPVVE